MLSNQASFTWLYLYLHSNLQVYLKHLLLKNNIEQSSFLTNGSLLSVSTAVHTSSSNPLSLHFIHTFRCTTEIAMLLVFSILKRFGPVDNREYPLLCGLKLDFDEAYWTELKFQRLKFSIILSSGESLPFWKSFGPEDIRMNRNKVLKRDINWKRFAEAL